jgi:hypothetical protein
LNFVFRLKDLELAKKAGDDLEKKAIRGNEKVLKSDFVRLIYSSNHIPSLFYILSRK